MLIPSHSLLWGNQNCKVFSLAQWSPTFAAWWTGGGVGGQRGWISLHAHTTFTNAALHMRTCPPLLWSSSEWAIAQRVETSGLAHTWITFLPNPIKLS